MDEQSGGLTGGTPVGTPAETSAETSVGVPPEEETQDVEELSPEELAESNNFVLSALIDLLIKKGVIRNEELQQAMDELEKAEEEDEQSDD